MLNETTALTPHCRQCAVSPPTPGFAVSKTSLFRKHRPVLNTPPCSETEQCHLSPKAVGLLRPSRFTETQYIMRVANYRWSTPLTSRRQKKNRREGMYGWFHALQSARSDSFRVSRYKCEAPERQEPLFREGRELVILTAAEGKLSLPRVSGQHEQHQRR